MTDITPLQRKLLEQVAEDQLLTISEIQRILRVSFVKACQLAKDLHDKGLIQSNIDQIKVELKPE